MKPYSDVSEHAAWGSREAGRASRERHAGQGTSAGPASIGAVRPAPTPALAHDTRLAVRVRELVRLGEADAARALFGDLVGAHQARALRIAYHYLREPTEAEDAVQDAFLKAYSHIASYRDAWPFGVWFTRILVNGCLDRQQARVRRGRWFVPWMAPEDIEGARPAFGGEPVADPEVQALTRERWARLARAVRRLGGRQRAVFVLCHFGDWSPREVGAMLDLTESTVRVHMHRAVHKLRSILGPRP